MQGEDGVCKVFLYPTATLQVINNAEDFDLKHHGRESLKTRMFIIRSLAHC